MISTKPVIVGCLLKNEKHGCLEEPWIWISISMDCRTDTKEASWTRKNALGVVSFIIMRQLLWTDDDQHELKKCRGSGESLKKIQCIVKIILLVRFSHTSASLGNLISISASAIKNNIIKYRESNRRNKECTKRSGYRRVLCASFNDRSEQVV